MSSPDKHENLERLARLRAEGVLTEAEFVREKELVLGQSDFLHDTSGRSEVSRSSRYKRRWSLWVPAGIAFCGASGWAMAQWVHVDSDGAAAQASLKRAPPAKTPAIPIRNDDSPSGARALPADRQAELAFDAVFGKGVRMINTPEDELHYEKGKVIWTEFGPVLIAEANGSASPVSMGALGVFYLREVPGPAFREIRRWPDAIAGSMMGNPPDWTVRADITDGPVIESRAGGVWQGYACNSSTLTQLIDSGPVSLVTFNSGYSDTGAVGEGGEKYDGVIANIKRNRSFDVHFTGTRPITEHYVKKGRGFVRVPGADEEMGESLVPTC